jgi:drug/metabolite transporter (DMT)-like permease
LLAQNIEFCKNRFNNEWWSNLHFCFYQLIKNGLKLRWFKNIGPFFIPVSLIGWIFLSGGLLLAVYIFIEIDSRSHSASDTLINFVFNLFLIGVVYTLIAYLVSRSRK